MGARFDILGGLAYVIDRGGAVLAVPVLPLLGDDTERPVHDRFDGRHRSSVTATRSTYRSKMGMRTVAVTTA